MEQEVLRAPIDNGVPGSARADVPGPPVGDVGEHPG
jgi:hypothetical protein